MPRRAMLLLLVTLVIIDSDMISAFHHTLRGQYVAKRLDQQILRFRDVGAGNICRSQILLMSSGSDTHVIKTLEPGSHVAEMEVKKSRFITYAKNVDNWEDAKAYISQVKKEHPKARHWCYGFQCGTNPVHERSSDDGEPSGTAGAPILGAIKGEELTDVVCIVVRYFGGVKLGAGGLIRAYGGAARQVLQESPIIATQQKSSFKIRVDASNVGAIYEAVNKAQALTSGEEYFADGSFAVSVTCEQAAADELKESIKDATKGAVEYEDS